MTVNEAIKAVTSKYDVSNYTAEQIKEMREWLIECAACGMYQDIEACDAREVIEDEYTDVQIIYAINRQYEGGVTAFIESI